MMKTVQSRLLAALLLAGALASFAFVGCSSDSSGPGGDPTVTDTGTRDTEAPPTDTGSPVDTGVAPDTGSPMTDGGSDAPWSLDSGVCFPGKPTKMVEYLNACTTADKVKFGKKLTKLNADGSRPALP